MKASCRKGALGSLMDEYERAAAELRRVTEPLSNEQFTRVVDSLTRNDNCRSVQTIMSHVVAAGHRYADYIRAAFSSVSDAPPRRMLSRQEGFDSMLAYTAAALEGRWKIADEEIMAISMKVR